MQARDEPSVEIDSVRVEFDQPDGGRMVAVEDVSATIAPGEFVCLLGPSGCGKSTLLNVIAGLGAPAAGTARVAGRPVTAIDPRVGYMFQKDALLPWATTLGNVLLPMEAAGAPDPDEARRLIRLVGLQGFERHYPWQLSGGMRKRVQLARLLAQKPDVLLMDEPFGALDAQTRLAMHEEFLRLWEANRQTVLFVTHDLAEAITLADRILLFSPRPGRIKAEYHVDLPRPRDVTGAMGQGGFHALFEKLWSALRHDAGDPGARERVPAR
jgi:NitT/TauT family transport system ATP-binding protein